MSENYMDTMAEDELAEFPEAEGREAPKTTRTLLEIWTDLLTHIEDSEQERIPLATAVRLVNKHAGLRMQEIPEYFRHYHDYLREIRWAVAEEVDAADPKAFQAENDAEDNQPHYFNILVNWMKMGDSWERSWDVSDENAHIVGAAIIDAYEFALGERGLAAQLDAIGFSWDDELAVQLQAAVQAE